MSQSAFGPASRSVPRVEFTGGAGAPTDAAYLVTAAHAGLSAEVVVGATPGGELGGSWSAPTVDASHAGGTHAAAQAAAEATAAAALAGHVAAGDPHTGYLKESDFATPDFLVGTATGLTAAEIVVGTSPGGELGGSWASPSVDASHSGSTHAAATAAAVSTSQATIDAEVAALEAAIAALELVDLADYTGGIPNDGNLLKWVFDVDTQTGGFQPSDVPFITDHSALSGRDNAAAHDQYAVAGHAHAGEAIVDNRITRSHNFNAISATTERVCFIAPFACRVRQMHVYRAGGTSASLNGRVNATTSILGADMVSTTDADDSSALIDVAMAEGDYLTARITAIVGSATIYVQFDIERIGA